jgi:putative secretion ATPase (PEP-CTERM system associated)
VYESFYGLSAKPFQLNPDPSFYYASKQHRRAMHYLEYGLHQNEGFIVITGDIGAGKTTVLRNLMQKLDPKKTVAAQLVSTQLGADDTLRMVCAAFGIKTSSTDKSDMLLQLEAFLVKLSLQGRRGLLIVDEAQNLAPHAVEELRMLSNYQLETHSLIQSFLVGQPEFRGILQSPQMQQLRQRVIAACHIGPMDAEETQGYIEHRLKRVGWNGNPRFEADAHKALFEVTEGIPRRINSVCDRLLLSGFLSSKRIFTALEVNLVARELRKETSSPVEAPALPVNGKAAHGPAPAGSTGPLSIDLSGIELDPETAEKATQVISGLKTSQIEERLARLEGTNAATLVVLQQLVDALRARQTTPKTEK